MCIINTIQILHFSISWLLPIPVCCVSVPQTVIEKHKMNVPETMNEVLDMSDDEGRDSVYGFILLQLVGEKICVTLNPSKNSQKILDRRPKVHKISG